MGKRDGRLGVEMVALILLVAIASMPSPVAAASSIDGLKQWLSAAPGERPKLEDQPFASEPLTRQQAEQTRRLLWDDHVATIRVNRQTEWNEQVIRDGAAVLALKEKHFGTKPKDGWRLFISMHGGGSAPKAVNDSQWENQIRLYQPPDSLYIAPRAPTNGWDLWHERHIDPLFARLIEDAIVLGDVDPNHVYIMGYSAGGDGVYQLAPAHGRPLGRGGDDGRASE